MAKDVLDNTSNKYCSQLGTKVINLCQETRFCGLCLNTDDKLLELNTEFLISLGQLTHKNVLRNIIDYIFNDLSPEILFSGYVCNHCTEKSIQSYIFIYNLKHMSEVFRKLLNDMYNKTENISSQLSEKSEDSNILIVLETKNENTDREITLKETPDSMLNSWSFADETNEIDDFIKEELITDKEDYLQPDEENNAIVEVNTQNDCVNVVFKDENRKTNLLDNSSSQPEINLCAEFLGNTRKGNTQQRAKINNLTSINEMRDLHPHTYKCNKCREILPSYYGWKKHYTLCRQKIDFKCKICCKSFITQTSLNCHYKIHSKIRCKICKFLVPLDDLTEHMKINHEDYTHLCTLCNYYTFDAKLLKQHVSKAHSGSICALCFKKEKNNSLKLHKCKFSCLHCMENICIHYKYLMSYREQILNKVSKIKCLDCDYVYHRREALLGHVNREHLNHHPFTCAHCSQQFFSKTTLKYHLDTYHKEHYKCEFCDQEFNTKSTLLNHRNDCETIKRYYQCDQCSSSFNVPDELANHVKVRHGNKSIDCNLCEKKFLSSLKLQLHKYKVHNGLQRKRNKSILNCPICKKHCMNKTQLMQHIKIHGSDITFPCAECPAVFENIKKLHAHMRLHNKDVIQCECCNKAITTTSYSRHKIYCKQGTNENEMLACETCGKRFLTQIQLKVHLRSHMEKVPCHVCGKLIKPFYMKSHIKQVHSKTTKNKNVSRRKTKYFVKCDWCNHIMNRLGELETHVNRFHLKIKPYECDYCKKTFFGKERLITHMVTHTTSQVCYCSVCNKKFENKVCLKIHMRLHTGYMPYTCELCGARFRTSSMLNTHKIKKHSEKSVSCPLCDSMFHLTRDMRRHFKTVHWKQKGKPFDPRDVKELKPEFYSLFQDGRLPTIDGEDVYISSQFNKKY